MNTKQKIVERIIGTKKTLWCPKCKCYPDKILEKNILYEPRVWDEEMECYIFDDSENQEEETEWTKCKICDTDVVERLI